ncbi:MAG: HAD family phosphatase, partial [Spirochaetaceae bacterium]|nr:HAD family phosphatase [Spirochaetaceae bacterium]
MKSYIFDLDGTLLDSMKLWEQIDIDFLTQRGLEVPPDYIGEICSRSFYEAAVYTVRRFGLPGSPESLMEEWNRMAVYAYGHTVEMKPF